MLAGRKRVGESGGVDIECCKKAPCLFFEASVNCSSVQRLRSSWLCSVSSAIEVGSAESCAKEDAPGETFELCWTVML